MPQNRIRQLKARATVLCLRSGKILMVRKKNGKWNFPGGKLESGESPLQAAEREFKEETNLNCSGLLPLCAIEAAGVLHHVFTTQFDHCAEPIASHEIAACKWVARSRLGGTSLTLAASALLARALPALSRRP